MASAQRWVVNQCCRCVLPCPDYKTPISGDRSDLTVWYVGICDVKCWILLTCFVYMAIYDFLTFSYFQLRSVGYIHVASYKLNFQNRQHWKCLIPRGPFKRVWLHSHTTTLSHHSNRTEQHSRTTALADHNTRTPQRSHGAALPNYFTSTKHHMLEQSMKHIFEIILS